MYHTCSVNPPYSLILSENVTAYCNADKNICQLETFHTWDLDTPHPFLTEIFFCRFTNCDISKHDDGSFAYSCTETTCGCGYCPDPLKPIISNLKGKAVLSCDTNNNCKLDQEKLFLSLGMICSPQTFGGCLNGRGF